MHGLIFVTWERYLTERFGAGLLKAYRMAIGETVLTAPLASRVYDDATLLAGVEAASRLTGQPTTTLLREYGRYFILNGLTGHLCAYLLSRVHNGRELLLTMRDAHAQMRRTPDNITPPLFSYEILSANSNEFALLYDSPRKLCTLLYGAIEGAAARYNEQVLIQEHTCMNRGEHACRFELRFMPLKAQFPQPASPELLLQRKIQQQLADMVLSSLPLQDGVTLLELHQLLQHSPLVTGAPRLSALLEALRHLQYAGLVASTANQAGDTLSYRRYWRAPTDSRP